MSRIGKKPIEIPAGVTVTVAGNDVTVKGPKGTLSRKVVDGIAVEVKDNHVVCTIVVNSKDVDAKHGLTRALLNNMVHGVTHGFTKTMIINGVGYKSQVNGNKLVLNIGYSHPVEMEAPAGIKFECTSATEIVVSGCDKELVGQTAANLKAKRPVEPYHAYGIRYKDEVVIMKEGKKAGK